MINFTSLISKVSKVSKVSQQNCESRMGTCQADAQHLPMTYLPVDSVSIVSRQSDLDNTHAFPRHFARLAAMVTLLLTLACGNVCGASPLTVETPDARYYTQDGVTVFGENTTGKMKNSSSQKCYNTNNASVIVFSELTNITGISFDMCLAGDGSGEGNAISLYTSTGGVFAIPSSGFTATKGGSALGSLSNIQAIKANQSSLTSISVTFDSPVKGIELKKVASTNIRNIVVTYNNTTLPSVYFKATTTSTADVANVETTPSGGSMTVDTKTTKKTINGIDYYQAESGSQTINLGTGNTFQAGDQIVLEFCGSGNNKTVGPIIQKTTNCTISVTVNDKVPAKVAYIVSAGDGIQGQTSATIIRTSSDLYIRSFSVLRAAAGCPNYSFHTGGNDVQTNNTQSCFVQVGSSNEWQLTNYTIPADTKFFVGERGWWYNNNLGSNNSRSSAQTWAAEMYLAMSFDAGDASGSPKLGQATGAVGTVRIYDNSNWNNLNAAFIPDGYVLKFGSTEKVFELVSGNEYRSADMMEYNSSSADDVVSVGVKNSSDGYVETAHTQEMRHVFLDVSTLWYADNAKFVLYDVTHSAFTCAMVAVSGVSNLYEGWVPSSCAKVIFVRRADNTLSFDSKWNQTGDLDLASDKNLFTISDWGTGSWSTYEKSGKFRMDDNSKSKNWYVRFCPYHVLTYDANGGSGAPAAQSVAADASPCQLTVSSTEPTRTDYIFEGWSTSSSAVSPDGAWDPGDTHAMTGDVTLYAVWTHCSGPSITAFSNSEGHNYNQGDVATTMTVTAAAGNGGTLHYHWYQYNVGQNPETQSIDAVGGTDANTYTPSTASAHEGQIFYCVVSEEGCSTTVKSAYSGAITVLAPPCEISDCGNASITYAIKVGSSGSQETDGSDFITSATPSNSTALGASTTIGLSTMTISDGNMKAAAATNDCFGSKPNMTGKLGVYNGSAYSSSYYLQFTFTVKGGYTFTPCDIQFIVQPVSNTADFCWEITDGTNIYGYGTRAGVLKGSDGGATVLTGLTSTSAMSTGTYYIRLYPNYNGSGNTFRMGTDVILKGTTAASVCTTSPTVTAGSNSSVTATTATVSCASGISSLGSAGCSISSYGFVISESANPEIGGIGVTQHEVGTSYASTGTSFSKNLTGLTASTTYYVRPYATNGNGTAYGTQTSFTTSVAPTLTSLVSGIRYDVADMVPAGTTISGSEQTPTGLSENTKFYLVGPTAMSVKNDSKTVDGINFANSYYFKAAATLSSNTPTDRAIKFILPCAGTVTAWLRQSAKVSLAKEGIAGTAFGSGNSEAYDKYSLDVASGGTYYIYATGSTTTLYAIKFDALVCDPLTVNRGGTSDGVYIVGQDGGVLTCSATTGTIATYQWKQYTSGQGIGDTINAIGSGATTASFTPHPTSAGIYYYLCRANDACGNVAVTSTTGTFVFNAACTSVAAPTGLTCSAQTGTSLTFTWTNAANASGYTATLYSDSGCESEVTHQDLGDVATVTFSTLSSATTYYCKVQSHGDGSTYCAAGGTTAAQSGTTKTLYTITYAKGSAGGASGDNFTDTKTHGVNLTLSSNSSAFTRSGYTYDGWSTNTDGFTKDYNLGGTYTANSAITLYPHWVANATISATLESDEYMRIGAAGMELSLSITGASSGWYYRVKNSDTEDYQTPDMTTYTTTSWTMTSTIEAATNHYVVELYNGSKVKMATSNTITVYGETGYPVTIVAGANGSVSPSGVVYANGEHLNPTITATPSSGYRFVNWELSDGNATLADATSASTTITSASGACTVTANFTACSTVTYMYNGATSGASPASETAASVTLPTPTRTGYVLDGWYTTAGTKVGDGGDTYDVEADITLYARWEESCAAGSEPVVIKLFDGSVDNDFASSPIIVSGVSLAYTAYDKPADATNVSSKTNNVNSKNYAKGYQFSTSEINKGANRKCLSFTIPEDYTATFTHAFGASGNDRVIRLGSSLVTSDSDDDYIATLVTVPGSGGSSGIWGGTYSSSLSAGTYFITGTGGGWQIVELIFSLTSTGGGGGTCYHVYYHGNGAESGYVSDTTSYANSASATILDYNDSRYPLTKAGYTFQGWATSADGAVAKTAGQTVTISSADVHYYAVWAVAAPTYDITNGNPSHGTIAITDGSSAITSAEENATVHISATPADGYSFTSWSVTKDAGGSVDVATSSSTNPTTFTMPAEAVTVTATFSPNTYTVTYNLNGASWASSAGVASYTVGTGATLPVAGDMTNIGYTFGGWYANSDLSTGGVKTSISTSDFGNKEFWAKWTENTYDVTYNANGGSGTTDAQNGHYVTLRDNGFTAPSGKTFVEWNTASDGSGSSYNEGEEVELTANLALYAIWANDYMITWDEDAKLSGVAATPNLGGGNYTITVSVADWTGSLTSSMISATTAGVTITNVAVDNSSSPKTITATFNVGASVEGTSITFQLDVPAVDVYGAKSSTKDITIDRCTGSSSGSDGVLFSAEFKDSGLGTDNICDAANTPYTFTTTELKSAPTGGSIKAYTTDNVNHMKFATNAISIAGSNGEIQIDLDNAIQTYDLFTYVNVNSSTSSAYLRHTFPDNTTDQIALTVYNSKETKVMLPAGYNGKTTLYIVRNNNNFNLHKAAVVRPAFLMLLRDDTPTASSTDLEGTDVGLTTSNYLSVITGGSASYTSPASGNLKIKRNSSKNYINFNNAAGYVKIVLNDALQEGDVIGFDSYNTNNLDFTTTAEHTSVITTTNQLYTVNSSSALKGKTTFYIWQYGGSSDFLRGLQIARSGVAGGGGGTDKITPTLTWSAPATENKEVGQADFTYSASTTSNTLGAITYTSSNTSVATVNASGKVHIVGIGSTTITATLAASGCYNGANLSYTLNVTSGCDDVAGTIVNNDGSTIAGDAVEMNNCETKTIKVTGHTAADGVTYQWYKDGATISGATGSSYTIPAGSTGEYYVTVTNTGSRHCAMVSTNTITVTATSALSVSNIVNQWYVKNGRRTPDIALWQTEGASSFTVKNNSTSAEITSIGGCTFYLGEDGIIYLKGTKSDGSAPSDMSAGDLVIKVEVSAGCGEPEISSTITIHQQATGRASIAFVSVGTEGGAVTDTTTGYYKTTPLYISLDYTLGGGAFDLTAQNIYWTTNEKSIREHYSQFDAILITDDPNTKKVPKGVSGDEAYKTKGYVNAFGTMIDVRPILTMEAFVSALTNWGSKGVAGNPSSPSPRPYEMRLQCKDHEIYSGLPAPSPGTNVWSEVIDGEEYRHVVMVDKTKSPYAGLADDEKTSGKNEVPALQGFSSEAMGDLLGLGVIANATLHAGIERQAEPAARLMLLGINAKALPNALTTEGKIVIENALEYLLKTNMEEVDDCSNFFTGATDTDWNKTTNWSKGTIPNYETRARILAPCVVSTTAHAAAIDIATGGTSVNKAGTCNGSLTINANGALVVGGEVRVATAPYFSKGKLQPTGVNDLVLNTNGSNQACLIFDNDKGDTKATVNLYSLGRKISDSNQFQYMAVPMNYVDVNPAFAGEGIYTYVWHEGSGWERRGYYTELYAFEGVGITTNATTASNYTMKGALASTKAQAIPITAENKKLNLIGNSWTAPIQISELEASDFGDATVESTVYIYSTGHDAPEGPQSGSTETAGQWLAIPFNAVGFGAWEGLKVIPSMQAFQIKASSAGTLTLDYSKHVRGGSTDLNAQLRAPQRKAENEDVQLMRIRVADSKTHTDLYLFEGEQFTDAFDDGWEANYRVGDNQSAKLYARTSIGVMAVAAMPSLESTPVYFIPGQETEYTFTFGGSGMGYYLNDLKLEKSTLISEGAEYTFTYERGDAAARFMISATPYGAPEIITGNEEIRSENKARKILYNNKLYIIVNGHVYSAEGALVK